MIVTLCAATFSCRAVVDLVVIMRQQGMPFEAIARTFRCQAIQAFVDLEKAYYIAKLELVRPVLLLFPCALNIGTLARACFTAHSASNSSKNVSTLLSSQNITQSRWRQHSSRSSSSTRRCG